MNIETPTVAHRATKPGKIYTSKFPVKAAGLDNHNDTLPKNFLLRVKEFGDRVAMRKKRYGIWQEYSWNEVYQHVCGLPPEIRRATLQRRFPVAMWVPEAAEARARFGGPSARMRPWCAVKRTIDGTEAVVLRAAPLQRVRVPSR